MIDSFKKITTSIYQQLKKLQKSENVIKSFKKTLLRA